MTSVDTGKGVEEIDCCGGKVHYVVIEDVGAGVFFRMAWGFFGFSRAFWFQADGEGFGLEEFLGGPWDELSSIFVEGKHELVDVVHFDSFLHGFCSMGVEVVCPDEDLAFACWYGKGADACHYVANHFTGVKFVD